MNCTYGDTVVYFTSEGYRTVLVDEVEEDIKNGRPGFGGTVISPETLKGQSVWGYNSQIVQVRRA